MHDKLGPGPGTGTGSGSGAYRWERERWDEDRQKDAVVCARAGGSNLVEQFDAIQASRMPLHVKMSFGLIGFLIAGLIIALVVALIHNPVGIGLAIGCPLLFVGVFCACGVLADWFDGEYD